MLKSWKSWTHVEPRSSDHILVENLYIADCQCLYFFFFYFFSRSHCFRMTKAVNKNYSFSSFPLSLFFWLLLLFWGFCLFVYLFFVSPPRLLIRWFSSQKLLAGVWLGMFMSCVSVSSKRLGQGPLWTSPIDTEFSCLCNAVYLVFIKLYAFFQSSMKTQ